MLPAHEGLESFDLPCGERDDGLVVEAELVPVHGSTQICLELQAALTARSCICWSKMEWRFLPRLLALYIAVSASLRTSSGRSYPLVPMGDTDAGGGKDLMALQIERHGSAHRGFSRRCELRPRVPSTALIKDCEFIATQSVQPCRRVASSFAVVGLWPPAACLPASDPDCR